MEKQKNVWDQLNYSTDELTDLGEKYGLSGSEIIGVIHELISGHQNDLNQFAGQIGSLKNAMEILLEEYFTSAETNLKEA